MKLSILQIFAVLKQYTFETVLRFFRNLQDSRRRWQVVQRVAYATTVLVLLALFVHLYNKWQFERRARLPQAEVVVPTTSPSTNKDSPQKPVSEELREVDVPIVVDKAVQGRILNKPNISKSEQQRLLRTLDAGNTEMSQQFQGGQ